MPKKWPSWLLSALLALKPPDKMLPSEWADKRRRLNSLTSSEPGKWRTERTEYLRGVMDAFADPEIEELWLCKPAQCGGTEAEYNILGYIIENDPGPTMIVYPDEKFAKRMSKTRIEPMILNCPTLRAKYIPDMSTDIEFHFTDMILLVAWAGSPAALAGMPCRYIILDEVAKYVGKTRNEASPISLAYERTHTYEGNRKIIGTSTPVVDTDNFYKRRAMADQIRRFYVPCPYCGHMQVMSFRYGVKWPADATAETALDQSWYECEKCKGRCNDQQKAEMVRNGRWDVFNKRTESKRSVWMEMSRLISPWMRIGKMAQEFLRVYDMPEELQGFINSWLGEPFQDDVISLDSDIVLERQSEYEEFVVPDEAIEITAGVDVQHGSLYWTVRAWGTHFTSWNLAHGQCLGLDWDAIERIMNRSWRKRSGEDLLISLCAVDSGDQTDDVYDFCTLNSEWAIPVKGSSVPLATPYRISKIDKLGNRNNGMSLVIVDSHAYKTMIAGRLKRANGRGAWMVHKDCDRGYADQVTSQQRVPKSKNGRTVWLWEPKVSHAEDHWLAAEVYCFAAADIRGLRSWEEVER